MKLRAAPTRPRPSSYRTGAHRGLAAIARSTCVAPGPRGWLGRATNSRRQVGNTIRIVQDEIFGAALTPIAVVDEHKAVVVAYNATCGLAASVSTRKPERARCGVQVRTVQVATKGADIIDSSALLDGIRTPALPPEHGSYGLEPYTE